MYELKDYLKAINETKEPLLDTDDVLKGKEISIFIINGVYQCFMIQSMHSNEMRFIHFLENII